MAIQGSNNYFTDKMRNDFLQKRDGAVFSEPEQY